MINRRDIPLPWWLAKRVLNRIMRRKYEKAARELAAELARDLGVAP